MKISVDYQPRPILPACNRPATEGILDLNFNGRADLVTLDGKQAEPVVDLLALQSLAKQTGRQLFTETELKSAGLAPKMVESGSGATTCYSDVCLAQTTGGQAMLEAARHDESQLKLEEQGYRIAGDMEFVVDPFNARVFISRKVEENR